PREPHQGERGRQQAAVGQIVDRRHHLLAGQVAGDAENHHAAGAGDSRQPLIPLVSQGVVPLCGVSRGPGWGHLWAESSCAWVSLSSSLQDASNFSTPSFSSTMKTSSKSIPTD